MSKTMAVVRSSNLSDFVDIHNLSEFMDALHIENNGDIGIILKNQLVIQALDSTNMSLLSLACHICNIRLVRTLLQQGYDVNEIGDNGKGPIHIVCGNEKNEVIKHHIAELLLQHGLDVDLVDSSGNTAVLLACSKNLVTLVELLTKAGCNVNISNDCGETPFSVACKIASDMWYFWNSDCLNNDSDDFVRDDQFPPVMICRTLLKAGCDSQQGTLLPTAVLFSSMDIVSEFIDLGMDVNMLDENGRSPLGCSCSASHIPSSMVKLLLERGADVNDGVSGRKSKPIIVAYVHNAVEKIILLLSYGAAISCEEMSELVSISLSKWFLENPEVINEESKELQSWKLLLKAGFRPKMSLLALKLKRVSLCSSYTKVSPWIYNLLFPLSSLSDICRVSVRSQLSPSIDEKANDLPLPNGLIEFLKFSEFLPVETL